MKQEELIESSPCQSFEAMDLPPFSFPGSITLLKAYLETMLQLERDKKDVARSTFLVRPRSEEKMLESMKRKPLLPSCGWHLADDARETNPVGESSSSPPQKKTKIL